MYQRFSDKHKLEFLETYIATRKHEIDMWAGEFTSDALL